MKTKNLIQKIARQHPLPRAIYSAQEDNREAHRLCLLSPLGQRYKTSKAGSGDCLKYILRLCLKLNRGPPHVTRVDLYFLFSCGRGALRKLR